MATTRTKSWQCLGCYKINDMATTIHCDGLPSKGDISICWYCGSVGVYDSDLTVRPATKDFMDIVMKVDPKTFILVKAAQQRILDRIRKS